MKNKTTAILALLFINIIAFGQVSFEPMFNFGVCLSKSETILSRYGVLPIKASSELNPLSIVGESIYSLKFNSNKKFIYHTNLGARFRYKGFSLESENDISIMTDNFLVNTPYTVDFYIRALYTYNKIDAGIEHLCVHPIVSENTGLKYRVRGGHTMLFLSYNMRR